MRCPSLRELPQPPPGKTGWPWTEENARLSDGIYDDSAWPGISIVTPSYNQGVFIEEAIRSVLLQGYPRLEYIIIDGGSTDGSLKIIKRYEKWIAHWVSEKDRGQSDALNKGFSKATGEILAWLNADDLYSPGALHKVAKYRVNHSCCSFLTGDGEIINHVGKKREYYIKADNYSFKDLLHYHRNKYLPQPSVFFSKEAYLEAGGLNVQLKYAMDLDLWIRIAERYYLYYLPACISKLRHHEDAKTWKENAAAMEEVKNVITKYVGKVDFLSQCYVIIENRFFCASALCRQGLREYFNGNQRGAIKLFKKALYENPAVLFSTVGLKLWLRLMLPASIKELIFNKP